MFAAVMRSVWVWLREMVVAAILAGVLRLVIAECALSGTGPGPL